MPPLLRFTALLLGLLGMLSLAAGGQGRTSRSLDGPWRFQFGQAEGDTSVGFDDGHFRIVSVPHSWPAEGEILPRGGDRARATYRRSFAVPLAWRNKRVVLQFEAVSLAADVVLNGTVLGSHKGAFATFNFDVTDRLKYGRTNLLALHVNNEADPDLSPLGGDFRTYGGIYRHVRLLILDPVHIDPLDLASPGVFLRQQSVSPEGATVEVRSEVANQSAALTVAEVQTAVFDRDGRVAASALSSLSLPAGAKTDAVQTLRLPHPHLWNGVADPYLYSVRVQILRRGKLADEVTQPLGLRTESVDPRRGFILNGRALQIRGVDLHQEGATAGWAVSAKDEARDMRLIREMGATGIRLAHYQHSQSFLDLADRSGMLVWAELAQVEGVSATPAYRENIRQQLKELIRQNFNHPSIFVWSLYNELNSPTKDAAIPLVAELHALAHQEDPGRPTSGAASADTADHLHAMVAGVDLISINTYPGWYAKLPEDMASIISKRNDEYGDRGLGVTEYGAGASIRQHKQDVKQADVEVRGHFHPEEWQSVVHEKNYAAIRARPEVWGSFIWNMFDFSSPGRHEGDTDGINDKGLVTQDRTVRKDAYFFYQANWTEKPMAHLTGCRDMHWPAGSAGVKAYSNADALTLTVNGQALAPVQGSPTHIFVWPAVALRLGENTLEVRSPTGAVDHCTVTADHPAPLTNAPEADSRDHHEPS